MLLLLAFCICLVFGYVFRRRLRKEWRRRGYQRMLARYREILRDNPGDDEAVGIRYMIGRILQVKLASFSEALQEYRTIVEKHAGHALADSALYNLGVCYEILGDKSRAELTYLRLLRKYPDSSRMEDARLRLEEFSYLDR